MRKRNLIGIFLVLGAAVLLVAARPKGETYSVTSRPLVRSAEIRGELEAEDSLTFGPPANIQSQWNFKISFMAPEGDLVDAGETLLAFDTTDLQLSLLEAMSKLETAETNLEKRLTSSDLEQEDRDLGLAEAEAEAERARLKAEAPDAVIASKELQQARIDLETANQRHHHLTDKAAAQAAQASSQLTSLHSEVRKRTSRVEQLQREINSMTVLAPSGGTVVYEANWRREKRKVGDQINRMDKVVALPNLDRLKASAQIDEVFAAELAVGQRVTFALDALPEDSFEGAIRGINPAVQQRSRRDPRMVVRVDIELLNPDPSRMRPGMRIQGELEILRTEDVPTLPIDGLIWREGKPMVEVQGWLRTRLVAPQLGRRDEHWVEITGGLAEGDQVILAKGSAGSTS